MICKLTKKEGSPVKAHIIPESFYLIDHESGVLQRLTNTQNQYPKRCPIGIYDTTIVTADGETIFGPWDDYAARLLLREFSKAIPLQQDGVTIGYRYNSYDYTKLKLFFLSVLWRAGASSQPDFRRVKLGPHSEIIRQHLLSNNPGDPDIYAILLAVFDEEPEWAKIMDPFPLRQGDSRILFYVFYIGNFIAYIKVDKRPAPDWIRMFQLTPNTPLTIIRRSFMKSKERQIMQKIVIANERMKKN